MFNDLKTGLKIGLFPLYAVWHTPGVLIKAGSAVYGTVTGAYAAQKRFHAWWHKKKPDTHGDAEFANHKRLKAEGLYEPESFLMLIDDKGRKVYSNPERGTLFLAPAGAGKSQHIAAHLRALKLRPRAKLSHLMIVDPSNEHFTMSEGLLTEMGYRCFRVSLQAPEKSASYDIMTYLRPKDIFKIDSQITTLAESIITEEAGAKNPHFVEFTRLLLKVVIAVNVKYEDNDRSICDLVGDLMYTSERKALMVRARAYNDKFINAALDAIDTMTGKGKDEGLSMVTTALRKLETWSNNEAIRHLSRIKPEATALRPRGWSFDDLIREEQPVAIFIHCGINTGTAEGDFMRLMFDNAINAILRYYDDHNRRIARTFEFIMDESGLIGRSKAVVLAYGRGRKAGVRLRMTFLGWTEFKDVYGKDAETMWSGMDVVVYGGAKDSPLYSLTSDFAGDFTLENPGVSEGQHGSTSSRNHQARRLVKPDDPIRLDKSKCLGLVNNIIIQGRKPWAKKGRDGPIVYL